MFCPKCGAKNEDGTKFCSSCGAPLSDPGIGAAGNTDTTGAAGGTSSSAANKGLFIMAGGAVVVIALVAVVVCHLFFAPWQIDERNFPDAAVRNVVTTRSSATNTTMQAESPR